MDGFWENMGSVLFTKMPHLDKQVQHAFNLEKRFAVRQRFCKEKETELRNYNFKSHNTNCSSPDQFVVSLYFFLFLKRDNMTFLDSKCTR